MKSGFKPMKFGRDYGSGVNNTGNRGPAGIGYRLTTGFLFPLLSENGNRRKIALRTKKKGIPFNPLVPTVRFIRVCPAHRVEVEDQDKYCWCPFGHKAKRWDVVKRPVGEVHITSGYELGVRG